MAFETLLNIQGYVVIFILLIAAYTWFNAKHSGILDLFKAKRLIDVSLLLFIPFLIRQFHFIKSADKDILDSVLFLVALFIITIFSLNEYVSIKGPKAKAIKEVKDKFESEIAKKELKIIEKRKKDLQKREKEIAKDIDKLNSKEKVLIAREKDINNKIAKLEKEKQEFSKDKNKTKSESKSLENKDVELQKKQKEIDYEILKLNKEKEELKKEKDRLKDKQKSLENSYRKLEDRLYEKIDTQKKVLKLKSRELYDLEKDLQDKTVETDKKH